MMEDVSRRAFTRFELLIVLLLMGVVLLMFLLAAPAWRENARTMDCRRNLGQIGVALAHYATLHHDELPPIEMGGQGPLAVLLQTVGDPDFRRLGSDLPTQARTDLAPVVASRVAGLVCPSDAISVPADFPAPVSYRANTGQGTDGQDGPFAPGKTSRFPEIEELKGLSFTAAFSERLVGNGRSVAASVNYARSPGPIAETGCSKVPATAWRGDAGSSWLKTDWSSTLYNHARPPDQPSSCVASDDATALMGASSGHGGRVHVLLLDGSVKVYRSQVSPTIWKALGKARDGSGP